MMVRPSAVNRSGGIHHAAHRTDDGLLLFGHALRQPSLLGGHGTPPVRCVAVAGRNRVPGGMASKEMMVPAPVVILLSERTFVRDCFGRHCAARGHCTSDYAFAGFRCWL